jgi:hypothetical protein
MSNTAFIILKEKNTLSLGAQSYNQPLHCNSFFPKGPEHCPAYIALRRRLEFDGAQHKPA